MRSENTGRHWHDAYDRLLTNTMSTHSAAQAEPEAPLTTERLAKMLADRLPLADCSLRVGSFLPLRRRLPEISDAAPIYGLPVTLDRNLPRHLGMLVEQRAASFMEYHWPRFTFIDMRSRPHSGDMGTMVDDLRRHGAVPFP